jgi:hypothetical protein
VAAETESDELLCVIQALHAIVAGSRDPALAGAPELHYSMAAEILYLIETLKGPPTA